jgi:hypothetical protein
VGEEAWTEENHKSSVICSDGDFSHVGGENYPGTHYDEVKMRETIRVGSIR